MDDAVLGILLFVLLDGFACAIASRIIAGRRGLPLGSAAIVGVILGPIGVLVTAASPVNQEALDDERVRIGEARRCTACRTVMSRDAAKCRNCGDQLPTPHKRH